MSFGTPQIYYYSACFFMIVICLMCAVIKLCHVCKPYRDDPKKYYPARYLYESALLFHLIFIPYLFGVGEELSIRYVTTMLLISHPFLYSILIDAGFFLKKIRLWWVLGVIIAIGGCVVMPAMYVIEANNMITPDMLRVMRFLPSCIFVAGVFYMIAPVKKLTMKISMRNRMNYSSEKDFPFPLAYITLLLPYGFSIYILVMYWFQSELMFSIFCLLFSLVVLAISIYSLSPIRDLSSMTRRESVVVNDIELEDSKNVGDYVQDENKSLVDEAAIEQMVSLTENDKLLVKQTEELMIGKQLFKISYLKISDVVAMLGTSKLALSNAIAKSHYGSFYNLVNSFRLQYAMELMDKMSDFKLRNISQESGFASPSQFSQFFKEQTGDTPSRWIKGRR